VLKRPAQGDNHSSPSGVEIKKELRCDTTPPILHGVPRDSFISTLNITRVLKLIYSFCPNWYVGIRIPFFWDMTLLLLAVSSQQCEGKFCLFVKSLELRPLKVKELRSFETSSADLLVVTQRNGVLNHAALKIAKLTTLPPHPPAYPRRPTFFTSQGFVCYLLEQLRSSSHKTTSNAFPDY